jgi:hypothetical protein
MLQTGCIPKANQAEIDQLTGEFCANMLLEVEDIARHKFPLERQDLFMEIREFKTKAAHLVMSHKLHYSR